MFVYFSSGASDEAEDKRLVVSQAQVELLARQFETTWHRLPTDQELAHLVETYVHDEILYRASKKRTTVGGQAVNDRLWKFECGCYEGFRPYRFYPCPEHRSRSRALVIGFRQL